MPRRAVRSQAVDAARATFFCRGAHRAGKHAPGRGGIVLFRRAGERARDRGETFLEFFRAGAYVLLHNAG
jgi:hypothetical protein